MPTHFTVRQFYKHSTIGNFNANVYSGQGVFLVSTLYDYNCSILKDGPGVDVMNFFKKAYADIKH